MIFLQSRSGGSPAMFARARRAVESLSTREAKTVEIKASTEPQRELVWTPFSS
jgi:hypothetical protein